MLADIIFIYTLRRQRRLVFLGIGVSSLLLGLVALATLSGFISGWPAVIILIGLLMVFIGSFYSAVRARRSKSSSGSSPSAQEQPEREKI